MYVDETQTSYIDGDTSTLLYRGYDVGDLGHHSTFEETAYLLLHGSLPNRKQLAEFDTSLKAKRPLPEVVGELIALSDGGNPMDVFRTAVSLLGATGDADSQNDVGVHFTASVPTIVAAVARARQGEAPGAPDMELGHAANLLYMLSGEKPQREDARLFDKVLVLHAEHGLNASTLAARVVASTGADVYGCISSVSRSRRIQARGRGRDRHTIPAGHQQSRQCPEHR